MPSPRTLGEIVDLLGGELVGEPSVAIQRVATLEAAGEGDIGFLANPRYQSKVAESRASAVIVAPSARDVTDAPRILTPDPYLYFARLAQLLSPARRARGGVARTAVLESDVPDSAEIGHGSWIGPGTTIGERVIVGAGCHVGAGVVIGDDTQLYPGVSIYDCCRLGARCIVHSGAVIGADGFGFAPDAAAGGAWVKIEQLGAVAIGDEVEIGANTCIDRGALADTVIGDGVKLDNLVQIGHNVRVGAHSAFAGCVGVAGSATIGRFCTAGGGAIILGHLEIVDHVHVSAATVITRSILKPGTYSGMFPFDDNAAWEKNAATLRQLHALRDRLRALEKRT